MRPAQQEALATKAAACTAPDLKPETQPPLKRKAAPLTSSIGSNRFQDKYLRSMVTSGHCRENSFQGVTQGVE
jgi:hypothetical protein